MVSQASGRRTDEFTSGKEEKEAVSLRLKKKREAQKAIKKHSGVDGAPEPLDGVAAPVARSRFRAWDVKDLWNDVSRAYAYRP